MFTKTGSVQLKDDLTLKDPNWIISEIRVDCINNLAYAQILMWEKEYVHSRTYEFPVLKEWTNETVLKAVLDMPQFKGSVPEKTTDNASADLIE